jgi:hypothetical protein
MLTQKEHQAMIMFDRLLMAAEENETVADLLDQTLNVARMIDPRPDDKVMYGPLQRMHFEWQQMKYRMDNLDKKMEQYINSQNRYPGTYSGTTGYPLTATGSSTSMWPSNPGWDLNSINAVGQTESIHPLSKAEIQNLIKNNCENMKLESSTTEELEKQISNLKTVMGKK